MSYVTPTNIEWVTHQWPIVIGCKNNHEWCWAMLFYKRLKDRMGWTEPFSEVRVRAEMWDKRFAKDTYVFVSSMSEPYYWKDEWWTRILARVRDNPRTTFIFLTHHLNTMRHGLNWPNVKWGLSITSNAILRIYLQRYDHRQPDDFVSIEPYFLTTPVITGIRWPKGLRVVTGALSPAKKTYVNQYKESFLHFLGTLRDTKHIIKGNARVFGVTPTVPDKATVPVKKKLLKEFWS